MKLTFGSFEKVWWHTLSITITEVIKIIAKESLQDIQDTWSKKFAIFSFRNFLHIVRWN